MSDGPKFKEPAPGLLGFISRLTGKARARREAFDSAQRTFSLLHHEFGPDEGQMIGDALGLDEVVIAFSEGLFLMARRALAGPEPRWAVEVLSDPGMKELVLEWSDSATPRNERQELAWHAQAVLTNHASQPARGAYEDGRVRASLSACCPRGTDPDTWPDAVLPPLGARASIKILAEIDAPGARRTLWRMDSGPLAR